MKKRVSKENRTKNDIKTAVINRYFHLSNDGANYSDIGNKFLKNFTQSEQKEIIRLLVKKKDSAEIGLLLNGLGSTGEKFDYLKLELLKIIKTVGDTYVVAHAIELLEDYEERYSIVSLLLEKIEDPDFLIKEACIYKLAYSRVKNDEVNRALAKCLSKRNITIKCSALEALAIHDAREYIERIKSMYESTRNRTLKLWIIISLAIFQSKMLENFFYRIKKRSGSFLNKAYASSGLMILNINPANELEFIIDLYKNGKIEWSELKEAVDFIEYKKELIPLIKKKLTSSSKLNSTEIDDLLEMIAETKRRIEGS